MKILNVIALLLIFSVSAVADQPKVEDSEEFEIQMPGIIENVDTSLVDDDGTMSVDFHNEDVRNILRYVADAYGLNLFIPNDVSGKSSVKLRNVTWRQIFELLLVLLS